jgi:hypothetical protein
VRDADASPLPDDPSPHWKIIANLSEMIFDLSEVIDDLSEMVNDQSHNLSRVISAAHKNRSGRVTQSVFDKPPSIQPRGRGQRAS